MRDIAVNGPDVIQVDARLWALGGIMFTWWPPRIALKTAQWCPICQKSH